MQPQPELILNKRLRMNVFSGPVSRMQIKLHRFVLALLLALFPALATSQSPTDPAELLKRAVANLVSNMLKGENYTFVENYHNINYDKKGKIKVDETAKHETVFIERTPYKRKVEENGKPLSGKAAEEEEKKYQATVAERRRMNAELKQSLFHREYRVNIGYDDWPMLFLASSGGEEIVDGRALIKLTLTPHSDLKPKSESQKDALRTSIQLWIDKADETPVHMRTEYLADGAHMMQGSTVELFWEKEAKDGVYLLMRSLIRYKTKYLWATIPGETEQKFSNYKRFSIDVKITPEPSQPQ